MGNRKRHESIDRMDAIIKKHDADVSAFGDIVEMYPAVFNKLRAELAALKQSLAQPAQEPFQKRVGDWMQACFGDEIAADKMERNHRFFEEATELVQACGMTASEAHQLVDYTFSRPVGEPKQEAGGVSVTLAALCNAQGINEGECAETELARVWTKVEQIRAKQAAKPKHSPLPIAQQPAQAAVPEGLIQVERKTLQGIADFLSASVQCQGGSPEEPPDFATEFDQQLQQCADELQHMLNAAPDSGEG